MQKVLDGIIHIGSDFYHTKFIVTDEKSIDIDKELIILMSKVLGTPIEYGKYQVKITLQLERLEQIK